MSDSILNLQADLISTECTIIECAVWACEMQHLPETARALRHAVDVLRSCAHVIRVETEPQNVDSRPHGYPGAGLSIP